MRILLDKFTKSFGLLTVIDKMTLKITDGEMLALLGPSGCGKSTTLFAICGIHKVSGGRILFGDRDVTHVAAQQRNVGVVFQSYALYPHMTVAENIAFPLQVKKLPTADITRQVAAMAELVHIENLLKRRPAEAFGRSAAARRPGARARHRAAHPAARRAARQSRRQVARGNAVSIRQLQLRIGITAILVTHDQAEAMSMCDRIAIMNAGEIIQIATPGEMYRDPRTEFVAGFLGNPPIAFLRGVAARGGFALASSDVILPLPASVTLPPPGRRLTLGIRPENFGPTATLPIRGRISFVETQGREKSLRPHPCERQRPAVDPAGPR